MSNTIETGYTRQQYARAVEAAHDALHQSPPDAHAAHEALHAVGGGQINAGCATHDPEAQAIAADLQRLWARPLPCGHEIGDLIGGAGAVTKCGACLKARQAAKGAVAP